MYPLSFAFPRLSLRTLSPPISSHITHKLSIRAMPESYASQSGPFKFGRFSKPKPKPRVSQAQHRANVVEAKERSKIEWEKKMELHRLENPITYEIIPASTPGFVHLHRVAATKGVITSDTWETVPEDDLKVDLYRVRMADNPKPSQQPNMPSFNVKARIDRAGKVHVKRDSSITKGLPSQCYTKQSAVAPHDGDAMDVDMD